MIERLIVATPKNIVDRSHLPQEELAKFEKVTGIKYTRRYEAGTLVMILRALEESGEKFEDVEAVVVVSQSPVNLSPCMAVVVHDHLGLPDHIPAFDVNHACDGFAFGLWLAHMMQKRILLICADQLRYGDDRMEGLIFSDAVAIALVEPTLGQIKNVFQHITEGKHASRLFCSTTGEMYMDGSHVFDYVTQNIPPLIKAFNEVCIADVLVPHQANLTMNKIIEAKSGFKGRTLYSIEQYGNQSMCSIPTALAYNENDILGKRVLLAGFGAGYTTTLASFRWPDHKVCSMVEI